MLLSNACLYAKYTEEQKQALSLSLSLSYIPHKDSNFYACLDKDQHFANIEDDITYFKSKGEVIVFGDMNACTKKNLT